IADIIGTQYELVDPPLVIRNVPEFVEVGLSATSVPMTVLYHGVMVRDRGLENLIRSVRMWEGTTRLILRGAGPPSYMTYLRSLVRDTGVSGRVTFEPPVPPSEVVAAANRADVGVVAQPVLNAQTKFALPNKLFEYVMAGLAVCVPDGGEMAQIVNQYGVGMTCGSASPAEIAAAINACSPQHVERFKRASLLAARQLNWGTESRVLTGAYDRLAAGPSLSMRGWGSAG